MEARKRGAGQRGPKGQWKEWDCLWQRRRIACTANCRYPEKESSGVSISHGACYIEHLGMLLRHCLLRCSLQLACPASGPKA